MAENNIDSAGDKQQEDSKADINKLMNKLISTLKPVYLLEHFVGIYRFSWKDGKIVPSNLIKKLYAFCLIILYIGFYFIFLDLPNVIDGTSSLVDVIDEIPIIVVLTQYVTTLITTNVFFSKSNQEIFTTLANLDSRLLTATNDEFYQKARAKVNKFVLLLAISHAFITVADLVTEDQINITRLMIFVPLFLIQRLEIIVFCLAVEMLIIRLNLINGYIAMFLKSIDGEKKSIFTVSDDIKSCKVTFNMIGRPSTANMKIRDLGTMYDTIGSVCSLINSVFNFQIFMTLVSTFTYIVVTIWTSLYYYRTPENHSGSLITIVIWCLTTLMMVAVMCFVCERLRATRNSTKVLVNQLIMDYSLPKIMRVQAKAFMELIEAWPLRVLIYDMFSVDITLMLKFISVSTTYLIVIIQVSHFA